MRFGSEDRSRSPVKVLFHSMALTVVHRIFEGIHRSKFFLVPRQISLFLFPIQAVQHTAYKCLQRSLSRFVRAANHIESFVKSNFFLSEFSETADDHFLYFQISSPAIIKLKGIQPHVQCLVQVFSLLFIPGTIDFLQHLSYKNAF